MNCMVSAIVLLCFGSLAYGQEMRPDYRPFTATIRARYWTESGQSTERIRAFTRAKNGSYVFRSDYQDPAGKQGAERGSFSYILNIPRRVFIYSDSVLKAAVVKPLVDDQEIDSLAQAYGRCSSLEDGSLRVIGKSTLLGLPVIEVEIERDDRSVVEEWMAPALQCFALKRTELLDGVLRVNIEATAIETKDPNEDIFEPPTGYARVSPLEIEDLYRNKFPGRELFGSRAYKMEEEYRRAVGTASQH